MLFEALICTSAQLSQQFLADESLLRHYVSPSEDLYSHKISEGYSKCGIQYTLPNKKSKLRERLEEVEDLLQHYPVACIACLSSSIIQIFLNTAVIIYVKTEQGELVGIEVVHGLAKLLRGQLMFAGQVTDRFMVLMCSGKLCLATNTPISADFEKQLQTKIVNLDTAVCYEPNLAVSDNKVCLWTTQGDLVVYTPIGPGVRELCRYKTAHRITACTFNKLNNAILTTELRQSSQGAVYHALSCSYNIVGKGEKSRIVELLKHRITHVRADVIAATYNHAGSKVLLGLDTGKIILHCDNIQRNFSTTVSNQGIVSFHWHPDDVMFAVVLKNGYVQFYDETLQLLSISFGGLPESSMLDVSRVFNNIRTVAKVAFCSDNTGVVMVERGPLIVFKITVPGVAVESLLLTLLHSYIRGEEYSRCSRLLRNCLAKLGTIQCVSNVVRQMLSGINLNFQQKHFDTAKELLLDLQHEKGCEELVLSLSHLIILKALHHQMYSEAMRLARKLDCSDTIILVDRYLKCAGLKATCSGPEQIKLNKKKKPAASPRVGGRPSPRSSLGAKSSPNMAAKSSPNMGAKSSPNMAVRGSPQSKGSPNTSAKNSPLLGARQSPLLLRSPHPGDRLV